MNQTKIGFFGDNKWASNTLLKLFKNKDVMVDFVVSRSHTQDFTLENLANELNLPHYKFKNINNLQTLEILKKYKSDLYISISYDQIFKENVIKLPQKGIINFHAGKLPFYRGRNILNWVLINGEKEFGLTVHYIDDGIDTGDIICQKIIDIKSTDNYRTLLNRSYKECPDMIIESINRINDTFFEPIKQSSMDPLGFYCGKRIPGDEKIIWDSNSEEIYNFVRALVQPGPVAETYLNSKVIKVKEIKLFKDVVDYKGIPGQILGFDSNSPIVKTKNNFVTAKIDDIKFKLKAGDRLG